MFCEHVPQALRLVLAADVDKFFHFDGFLKIFAGDIAGGKLVGLVQARHEIDIRRLNKLAACPFCGRFSLDRPNHPERRQGRRAGSRQDKGRLLPHFWLPPGKRLLENQE
jgi:hypothetical protein